MSNQKSQPALQHRPPLDEIIAKAEKRAAEKQATRAKSTNGSSSGDVPEREIMRLTISFERS